MVQTQFETVEAEVDETMRQIDAASNAYETGDHETMLQHLRNAVEIGEANDRSLDAIERFCDDWESGDLPQSLRDDASDLFEAWQAQLDMIKNLAGGTPPL